MVTGTGFSPSGSPSIDSNGLETPGHTPSAVGVQYTNTKKNSPGPKLQTLPNFSWCRAGVFASIEARHGQGRATPSAPPARRQTPTRTAVWIGIHACATLVLVTFYRLSRYKARANERIRTAGMRITGAPDGGSRE